MDDERDEGAEEERPAEDLADDVLHLHRLPYAALSSGLLRSRFRMYRSFVSESAR